MSPTAIQSGRRVPVSTTLYEGFAGVRLTVIGGEFSAGSLPIGAQAYAGTVGGRTVRILGARPSAADKSMMVVSFAWDDLK